MSKHAKLWLGVGGALVCLVAVIWGLYYAVDRIAGSGNLAEGFGLLFFFLLCLFFFLFGVRSLVLKIKYAVTGDKEKAKKIQMAAILAPGTIGLIGCLALLYVANIAIQSKDNIREELYVREKGKVIHVPFKNVRVERYDNTEYIHTNLDGDQPYSNLYSLITDWKDSTNNNTYTYRVNGYTYDPALFLREPAFFDMYVDPGNNYRYYFDDSWMPDAQSKKYKSDDMRQQLVAEHKGKKITVPVASVIVDHHHSSDNPRATSKADQKVFCCYVMMALWKNPANGELVSFKTPHLRENDPTAHLRQQKEVTVYIDPADPWKYYFDDSFLEQPLKKW